MATTAIVVYCLRRYAAAPSWTARAISCIRSFPAGCLSSHHVKYSPYKTATAAHASANPTAWSTKKSMILRSPAHHKVSAESPRRGRLCITSRHVARGPPARSAGAACLSGQGSAVVEPVLQLGNRHRVSDVVSLRGITPELGEHGGRVLVLNPFGDHGETERPRHLDRAAYDRSIAVSRGHVLDECAVDLQLAQTQLLEVLERGVTRTEVIQGDVHAQGGQALDRHLCAIRVDHQLGLGDLQLEHACRHVVVVEKMLDQLGEPGIDEIRDRDVHRDG